MKTIIIDNDNDYAEEVFCCPHCGGNTAEVNTCLVDGKDADGKRRCWDYWCIAEEIEMEDGQWVSCACYGDFMEGDEPPLQDNNDQDWYWQDDDYRCHGCKKLIAGVKDE